MCLITLQGCEAHVKCFTVLSLYVSLKDRQTYRLCLYTTEKRCRWYTAFGSVRLWVSACVPKPSERHISKTNEGNCTKFWTQLGSHCLVFGIKGQGHSRQWPGKQGEYYIFVIIWSNFTKISWYMNTALGHTDEVEVASGNDRMNTISS